MTVRVEVAADFLDIFQIRGLETGPAALSAGLRSEQTPDGVRFADDATGLATLVRFDPAPEAWDGQVAHVVAGAAARPRLAAGHRRAGREPGGARARPRRVPRDAAAASPTPSTCGPTPRTSPGRAGAPSPTSTPSRSPTPSIPGGAWSPRGSPGSWPSSAGTA